MPDYAVGTAFTGRDQVTPVFERMGDSADKFRERTSSAFRNSTKEGYKFATIVKGILAANLIRGGIDKVTSGLQRVGTDFLTFDDTVIGAVARFDDIGPSAKNAGDMIGYIGKQTRDIVKGTRFTAVDAAKSVNELAKAGFDSKTALGVMPQMLAFATANQEDLAESTTGVTNIMGAFDLRVGDAANQVKNMSIVHDQLTKAALLSTGGLRELLETMKEAAPIANITHQSKEEFLAMAVALDQAGIKGEQAGTALKRASLQIFAGGMAAELKANGIAISDGMGNYRRLSDVMSDIGAKLKPLREDVRVPILRRLFGMYGLSGSLQLMGQLDKINKYREQIVNSQGTTEKVANFQNLSTYAKLIMLTNAALEKGFQIVEKFTGSANGGTEGLIKRIDKFNITPVVDGLRAFATIVKISYNVVEPFLPMLPYLVAGFYGIGLAGKLIVAYNWVRVFTLGTIAMSAGLGPVTAMSTAFSGLAASLSATQVAMVGVVGAFSWWEAIKSFKDGTDNPISKMAQNLGLVPELRVGSGGVVSGGERLYAPNATIAGQQSQFQGTLNITGAPSGSTLTTTQAAPGFNASLLGANP